MLEFLEENLPVHEPLLQSGSRSPAKLVADLRWNGYAISRQNFDNPSLRSDLLHIHEVQRNFGPVGCLVKRGIVGFELIGSQVAEGGVLAESVVVSIDVLKDLDARVGRSIEAAALKHFVFEGADEGLGPGVMVGVGASGHALAEAGLGEGLAEGGAGVLAAAVAVEDGALSGAGLECLPEGVEDEIRAEMIGQSPAEDAPGVEVDDDGEVEPTGGGGDEGDIPGPGTVRSGWKRLAVEEIRRRFVGATVAGFGHEVPGLESAQAALGHETADSGWSTRKTVIGEDGAQAAVSIASAVAAKSGLDQIAQGGIGELRLGGSRRVVKAAARQVENRADQTDAGPGLLGDKGNHRAGGCRVLEPRMTAAFFKMSFSSLSWVSSRRKRRHSGGPIYRAHLR